MTSVSPRSVTALPADAARSWRRPTVALLVAGLTASVLAVSTEPAAAADAVFVVTSTGDAPDSARDRLCATAAGECTLRAALTEANRVSGHATIAFALAGTAPFTIAPSTKLPGLTNPAGITIDGYTQQGSLPNTDELADNARIAVQVKGVGSSGAAAFDGFTITTPGNVVRGLAVYSFAKAFNLAGSAADGNRIVGNFICTNAAGTFRSSTVSTKAFGVLMTSGASGNVVGAPGAENRNVISGCAHRGVSMSFATSGTSGTVENKVQNNIVGLTPDGTAGLGNLAHGIDVNYTNSNLIGGSGPQERNVVSGNNSTGIEVSHGRSTRLNQVVGNFIGTDLTGKLAPAYAKNLQWGIRLEGPKQCEPCTEAGVAEGLPSNNTVRGNVIVNNAKGGILIDKGQNRATVEGNKIGVTADGTAAGNGFFGIRIERGAYSNTVGPGNEIAYNPKGVTLASNGYAPPGSSQPTHGNRITGNSIHHNSGLGVDLAPFGQVNTGGVGDVNTNEQVQVPLLGAVTASSVSGTTCAGCTVEVYRADTTKAGAYGEGIALLGTGKADAGGSFTVPVSAAGAFVSAIATTPGGSSSEFSMAKKLPAA